MGKMSRDKGARFERELVNDLKAYGLDAKRVPLSGATVFAKNDIRVTAGFDPKITLSGEAKRRKNLPEWIEQALEGADFMVMREDGGKSLVVIRLPLFAELLQ